MEILNIVVVKYPDPEGFLVLPEDDWNLLSNFNFRGKEVGKYTIDKSDLKKFKSLLSTMYFTANGNRVFDDDVKNKIEKFKKIIHPQPQQENNKQPKGIMAAYYTAKAQEYK